MFLIEFSKGEFIDGEMITSVNTNGGSITFMLSCEPEGSYTVSKEKEAEFINHLSVLNTNINKLTVDK